MFLITWRKSKDSYHVPIAIVPTRYRAERIICYLEWSGEFILTRLKDNSTFNRPSRSKGNTYVHA